MLNPCQWCEMQPCACDDDARLAERFQLFTDDEWDDIEVSVMRAPAFGAHTRKQQERLINKIRRARSEASEWRQKKGKADA